MEVGIYKITNPKGKVYIGQSCRLSIRKKQYQYLPKKQPKILNSILKYGWVNHKFEIIEYCTIKELHEKESFYKEEFIKNKGWKKALFFNINDRERVNGHLSKEHKNHISKGNYNPIYEYYLDGTFKTEWYNMNIASTTLNISSGYLHTILNSKTSSHTFNNSRWSKYKTDKLDFPIGKYEGLKKPVYQYDKNMNLIKKHKSVREAAKFMDTKPQHISAACLKKIQTCKGFILEYELKT